MWEQSTHAKNLDPELKAVFKSITGCLKSINVANHFLRAVVVVDLPLLRVAVEGSDNPVSLEKPCQASLPPHQQGRHSLERPPEGQYPGLDSMSPARSRRSASHAAGTQGWLPKKTGRPGLRRGGVGGYNLHIVPPDSPPDCGTPTTSRLYPFGAFLRARIALPHIIVIVTQHVNLLECSLWPQNLMLYEKAEFLRTDILPGVNYMSGTQYKIVVNLTFRT